MFINKIFESENRIVHLVRFRSLDVRNAVFRGRINLGFRSRIWINEDLIPSKESLALGARRCYRKGKIAKNWTFQGEVFIAMKSDPTPIKIMCQEDFPPETALKEGEGMLPREQPIRRIPNYGYQQRIIQNPGPSSLNPNGPPRITTDPSSLQHPRYPMINPRETLLHKDNFNIKIRDK